MIDVIEPKLIEFAETVRDYHPRNAVAMTLRITNEGMELSWEFRDPKALKESGITMRQIDGEWVSND